MERGLNNVPDTPFAALPLPNASHAIEAMAPTGSMNRSQSLESRHSSMGSTGWRIRDDDMAEAEDEPNGDASRRSTAAKEKWKKSLRLVAKGIAFSRTFTTLRDMTEENYIDPSRLTKIKDLGVGAFATVELCWLAGEDGEPPVKVAVKRLHYQALRSKKDLDCFFKEAALMRRIQHRYIAGYVGVGNFSAERTPVTATEARTMLRSTYLVQEFIHGGALKDIVIDQMLAPKPLYTDQEACVWMRQLAEGIAYLHACKPMVMHRDLKLDNVLLRTTDQGRDVCIVDFGLSVLLPHDSNDQGSAANLKPGPLATRSTIGKDCESLSSQIEDDLNAADVALSKSRSITKGEYALPQLGPSLKTMRFDLSGKAGSFMYMAPEVFKSQSYNEKADVFSFGCCLQEVFSRVVTSTVVVGPTGNPNAPAVYGLKVAEGYRRPLAKNMPEPIKQLVTDCWAQDPHLRPKMSEVHRRMLELEQSEAFAPRPKGSTKAAGRAAAKQQNGQPSTAVAASKEGGCCGCVIT